MRQIFHALRCLSVALVLVAAFVTLSPVQEASAASREQVEAACYAAGGEYYEIPIYDPAAPLNENNVVIDYGCWNTDSGTEIDCHDWGQGADNPCFVTPGSGPGGGAPNKPERHIGDPLPNSSHPPGGGLVDQTY